MNTRKRLLNLSTLAVLAATTMPPTACVRPTAGDSATISDASDTNATGFTVTQQSAPRRYDGPKPRVLDPTREGGAEPAAEQLAAGIQGVRFYVDVNDAPSRGPVDAPITLVMFSDFECPSCEAGLDAVKQLESIYPGKIRFVYKASPIDMHPNAMIAALAAHTALKQGKFWGFHDKLFRQKGLTREVVEQLAAQSDLDMPALRRELNDLTQAPAVRKNLREAKRLAIRSTPTFFLNGIHIRGSQPVESFQQLIDLELDQLQRIQDRDDVPGTTAYAKLTAWAFTDVARQRKSNRPRLDEDMIFPVPIGSSPQRGPANALVTIVVFGDFECPFCVRGNETLDALRHRYGDQLRIVYKNFPLNFHELASPAARAALAAGEQGKFWEFHDALFAQQARLDESTFDRIAASLGLNAEQFRSDRISHKFDTQLEADMNVAARIGVTGTPAFFVNGRPLTGARPEMQFRMLIVDELSRAKALLESGVEPADIYERLTIPQ